MKRKLIIIGAFAVMGFIGTIAATHETAAQRAQREALEVLIEEVRDSAARAVAACAVLYGGDKFQWELKAHVAMGKARDSLTGEKATDFLPGGTITNNCGWYLNGVK